MVGMGVLKSHAPMGAVRVSCVSGCACTPVEFDTHWDQKISLRQLLYFNATCHPDCVLRFTNAEYVNSTAHDGSTLQGHRLKLDTLVVRPRSHAGWRGPGTASSAAGITHDLPLVDPARLTSVEHDYSTAHSGRAREGHSLEPGTLVVFPRQYPAGRLMTECLLVCLLLRRL